MFEVFVVRGRTSRTADRVIVGERNVRKMLIPIILASVHHNQEHLDNRTIHSRYTVITHRIVSFCGERFPIGHCVSLTVRESSEQCCWPCSFRHGLGQLHLEIQSFIRLFVVLSATESYANA